MRVIATRLLIKKYNGESYALYRPAFRNAITAPILLHVIEIKDDYVRATDRISLLSGYTPSSYRKALLCRVYIKMEFLGMSIDITEDPRLNDILFSTHLLVSKHGKIKRPLYKDSALT